MDERVERTVDSFFGDDDHVMTPRGEVDTTRSAGSAVSSVSSSASSRSASSASSSASSQSAVSTPRSASSSAASTPRDHSSAPSTARSDSSSEEDDTAPEKTVPLDTERTNATYESNDFEPETPKNHEPEKIKEIEDEKEVEMEHPVLPVNEIGAGDANILTVNIPSGKSKVEEEIDVDSDFTDVSPMITPRPDPVVAPVESDHENEIVVTKSVSQVKVNAASRPKSAHPNKGRTRKASHSSVASKNSVNSSLSDFSHDLKHQNQTQKHRERLLYNTSKSSKDLNQLLEAVLVLDQKGKKRERIQNPNPFPAHAVGGSSAGGSRAGSARKQNFKEIERQKEIQKENDRLLKELTRQRRRPTSAVSVTSGRSRISNASVGSAYSTASAFELRRTNNCKYSPVARNYHSKINRDKESKRIDQENLALLRRLQNVKPSVQIQVSRQAVSTTPIQRKTRPKNMRPKIVNTWTDGW